MAGPTADVADPHAANPRGAHSLAPDREPAPNPILLVHSINASASAHEVRPLFAALAARGPTYAIDLPGYGHSERSERTYDQRLMIDALHAMIDRIRDENDRKPVDALAVSISCEFLARAALEAPATIRSLALVSPTGLAKNAFTRGPPDADCRKPAVLRVLEVPWIGQPLFRLLRSPTSIRFFLRKTWGRKAIDEEFFRISCLMARFPGAHRAPFHFLSGYLFGADMPTNYAALGLPTWLSHGVRGDFTDFSRAAVVADRPNWRITAFPTGALPYLELPERFLASYQDVLERVDDGLALKP
ncbi:alpha/beta hydrolase [Wenzhouxiangella sp. XN79A]|uniref:alpha/beta fold hydrolase n=1 Tax=Wenzhouxiangella sp. XN79A TaxID=2724193 RepID=UPI003217F854